jgi:hypothetical protein
VRASISLVCVALACAACGRYGFQGSPCDGKVHQADGSKADSSKPDSGSAMAVEYVQSNVAVGTGGLQVTYPLAQTAGDLNIVICVTSMSLESLTDSAGNSYRAAVGPTTDPTYAQAIYYASDIHAAAAGDNTVTIGDGGGDDWLAVIEYSPVGPIDTTDAMSGGGGNPPDTGSFMVTHANDFLVAAAFADGATLTGPGLGFTEREFDSNVLIEDMTLGSTGFFSGTAQETNASNWIIQTVAFQPQ